MTQELLKVLSDILSNETKLANIELEAMSRLHKMDMQGFKRYFKMRAEDRFKHSLCLKRWAIDYAETNIAFDTTYSSGNSNMTLEQVLTYVYTESETHLDKLKIAMDMLFKEKEITFANKINYLIDDQEEEHKYLRRIIGEWTFAKNYNDVSWISRKDHLLHKKYKKKG